MIVAACTVTATPNELVVSVHDRMPGTLPRNTNSEWLDPDTDEDRLLDLLRPDPAAAMSARDIGPAVNSLRVDTPACFAAV